MGTSKTFDELGGKLVHAGKNVTEARNASFRNAERRMRPRFRDQARAAAGGNRILSRHRSKAPLDAQFRVKTGKLMSHLFINPTGPWGIRDNTDIGGRTASHTIRPRRARYLKFIGRNGLTYVRVVSHEGSSRAPFWAKARDEAFKYMARRLPEETIRAIEAALSGSGFRSRG